MKGTLRVWAAMAAALAGAGCGDDDGGPVDAGGDRALDGRRERPADLPDAADDGGPDRVTDGRDAADGGDGGAGSCGAGAASGTRSQYVLNAILLPATAGDARRYSLDVDGNGTSDNAFGTLIAGLGGFGGYDMQSEVDDALADGRMLVGVQLWADSLTADELSQFQMLQLRDTDGNPLDNFSGAEEFGLDPASPRDVRLCGDIAAGTGEWGPGEVQLSFPILAGTPLPLRLVGARLRGGVAARSLGTLAAPVVLGGAIPATSIDEEIVPAVATMLDALASAEPCSSICEQLRAAFDTNRDGSITPEEVRDNPLVGLALTPDVVVGGEPALSFGIGLTATSAVIAGAPTE